VPDVWKHAFVTPLPKTSDLSDPSKFRPISVVPAISKVLERVVHQQLYAYFTRHDLFSQYQHGYRTHHSTETALMEVNDKILSAMDRSEISLLVLIDLSKCFDVVDHSMLLNKLRLYNIDTTWFQNYLQGHTQQVRFRDSNGKEHVSASLPNSMGVYQGTCLGPLLFSIFSNDLSLYSRDAQIYQYADDTQVLVSGKKKDVQSIVARMESALSSLSEWFASHSMKVNSSKTQLIVFGTKTMLRNFPEVRINFSTSVLSESRTVKNLGLVMDRNLTFDSHVDQLVGKCTGMLVALSHAKHSLPSDIISSLVTSLVTSHIRYCISIYTTYGQAQKDRVQKLLNFCARVVCGRRKFDHISADFKRLEWLDAVQLTSYHRLCLIKRVLTTGHPTGILQHFTTADHHHDTRARDQLQRPRARFNSGARRLCFSGADAYNRLPPNLRELGLPQFKARLREWLRHDAG